MNDFVLNIIDFSNLLQTFIQLFSIYGIYALARDWMNVTVKLSIGSFSIKRKYYDVQNITNIVSASFYDGGQVPPEIRREIIELTCPKIKNVSKK